MSYFSNKNQLHGAVLHKAIISGVQIALIEVGPEDDDSSYGVYKITAANRDTSMLVKTRKATKQRNDWVCQLIFSELEISWLNNLNQTNKSIAVVTKEGTKYHLFYVNPDRFDEVKIKIINGTLLVKRTNGGSFKIEGIEGSFPQSDFEKMFS